MSIHAQIIDQQVNGLLTRLDATLSDEFGIGGDQDKKRGIAFLVLLAKTMFDQTDDEAIEGIVDGGDDFGIDGLYFEPPQQGEIKITLIQSKYRSNLDGSSAFPENSIIKMINAISAIFDPNKKVIVNDRLKIRIEEIHSFIADGAIPKVSAIAANNGSCWTKQAQNRIDNSVQEFGDQVVWQHVGSEELFSMLQVQNPIDTEIHLFGHAMVETFDFRRVLIGRMPVSELARLTQDHGDRLFEKNIRRYFGLRRNRVNEAVAQTLQEPSQRSNFYFYNNGITITCSQFRHNALQAENWVVKVNDLQIVNGGQTARTAQRVAAELRQNISDAEVLVRVYELPKEDDALVEAITIATNSQNPVELSDLKANDVRQSLLGVSMRELGYLYRAKREDKPLATNEFTSELVANAVLAIWRKRPYQAGSGIRDLYDTLYETIFTEGLNGAQAIVAVMLYRQTERIRRRPHVDVPHHLVYGSRFIAMLMGQYLLDDLRIELQSLDHRNFKEAIDLINRNSEEYLVRAAAAISDALDMLANGRELAPFQFFSIFRRVDMIELLLSDESKD